MEDFNDKFESLWSGFKASITEQREKALASTKDNIKGLFQDATEVETVSSMADGEFDPSEGRIFTDDPSEDDGITTCTLFASRVGITVTMTFTKQGLFDLAEHALLRAAQFPADQ